MHANYLFYLTCKCLWISRGTNLFNIVGTKNHLQFTVFIVFTSSRYCVIFLVYFIFCHLILFLRSKCYIMFFLQSVLIQITFKLTYTLFVTVWADAPSLATLFIHSATSGVSIQVLIASLLYHSTISDVLFISFDHGIEAHHVGIGKNALVYGKAYDTLI